MTNLPEVHVLALETGGGYLIQEVPKDAWKKLSPTLRQHRLVVGNVVYMIKAQTWMEDEQLNINLEDFANSHQAVDSA